MTTRRRGLFLGVGVSTYRHHARLARAGSDVLRVGALVQRDLDVVTLIDPTEHQVRERVAAVRDVGVGGGPLVLMWSGHARALRDDLRLMATDTTTHVSAGITAREIALPLADAGASQLLLIIDACHSGEAAIPSVAAALNLLGQEPSMIGHLWMGVLASSQPSQPAYDGVFGRRLIGLLTNGPRDPELRTQWSSRNRRITGVHLADALLKEWRVDEQVPFFLNMGSAYFMLPNPLHNVGAAGERTTRRLFGRRAELNHVTNWARSGRPGVYVVTGAAGTGKSALVDRVRPLARGHVYAHGLTAGRLAELLHHELVPAGVLAADATAEDLVQRMAAAPNRSAPVVVVDGLDEARSDAFVTARTVLRPLSAVLTVIVATRDLADPAGGSGLIDTLDAREILDLGSPARTASTRIGLKAYVRSRLTGVSATMEASEVAEHVATTTDGPTFLLARILTDHLRDRPVDTGQPDWPNRIHQSLSAALAADLAIVDPPAHRDLGADLPPAALARHLLAALTWAFGAGFPEDEWIAVADATGPIGPRITRADTTWLVEQVGRHLVWDSEDGVACYRLANQSIADLLNPMNGPSGDPKARTAGAALLDRYDGLLRGRMPADEPRYLWHYGWRHAVEAGPIGVHQLRGLADRDGALRPMVAIAELELATVLRGIGQGREAVDHATSAVAHYRELSADDPGFRPDLAGALTNLGAAYRDLRRTAEAEDVTREAVATYRVLVERRPELRPHLANALHNLGHYLRNGGRIDEAVAHAREAVAILRVDAATDASLDPELALALIGLAECQRAHERHVEVLRTAREAVDLYRSAVGDRPALRAALAAALTTLVAGLRATRRGGEALAAAREAVNLYRETSRSDAVWRPALGGALANLTACLLEADDADAAVTAGVEAVSIHRDVVAGSPQYRGNLALARRNLSAALRIGATVLPDGGTALAVADDAVTDYRQAVVDGVADADDLRRALMNRAACHEAAGDHAAGERDRLEAARLRREIPADVNVSNPG